MESSDSILKAHMNSITNLDPNTKSKYAFIIEPDGRCKSLMI